MQGPNDYSRGAAAVRQVGRSWRETRRRGNCTPQDLLDAAFAHDTTDGGASNDAPIVMPSTGSAQTLDLSGVSVAIR